MKDRIPVDANRKLITPEVGDPFYATVEYADGATELGTPLNKANLLDDTTEIAIFGDASNRTVNQALLANHNNSISNMNEAKNESLIRDLNIMLNLSLGTSNIDAWADLLIDNSMIDTVWSCGYNITDGHIALNAGGGSITQTQSNSQKKLNTTTTYLSQTILSPSTTKDLDYITLALTSFGSPTGVLGCKILISATGELVAKATNTIGKNDIVSLRGTFYFQNAHLEAGVLYRVVIYPIGTVDSSNYFSWYYYNNANVYADGEGYYSTDSGSSWSSIGRDYYFEIYFKSYTEATVYWEVTPTEAFTYAAITTEQEKNSGTITWYMSDDSISWVKILYENIMQEVDFNEVNLVLKCVLTSDATVSAVAWGGT